MPEIFLYTWDKIRKNFSVLYGEWVIFGAAVKANNIRLRHGNWDYKDRQHFIPHVLKAYISDFTGMRRTIAELLTIALVLWLLSLIF